MFLRAQREGVHVDAGIRGTGVVLEGLDHVEVRALTLREAVLAVELELGRDDRVLTPAVHVESGLRQDEGTGIGHVRARGGTGLGAERQLSHLGRATVRGSLPHGSRSGGTVVGTCVVEEARGHDEVGRGRLRGATKRVDGVGQSVDRIRVVERLGTQGLEEHLGVVQGSTVVDVGVRLHDPDELLARVVEVQLYLVRAAAHRLIAGKLHLLDEVLVGVLGHLASFIRVQEHIVDVEGRRHQRLLVGDGGRDRAHRRGGLGQGLDAPQALADGADVQVDLDLVVLYEPHLPPLSGNLLAFS